MMKSDRALNIGASAFGQAPLPTACPHEESPAYRPAKGKPRSGGAFLWAESQGSRYVWAAARLLRGDLYGIARRRRSELASDNDPHRGSISSRCSGCSQRGHSQSTRLPEALRGGNLQVNRPGPERSSGSFIELAPEPVVRPQRGLRLLLVAGLVEHPGPTLRRGSEWLAAPGARSDAHLRIVADALDLGDVCLAANVELPVAEPEPHGGRHRIPAALVGHEEAVLVTSQVFESRNGLLLVCKRASRRVPDPVVEAIRE